MLEGVKYEEPLFWAFLGFFGARGLGRASRGFLGVGGCRGPLGGGLPGDGRLRRLLEVVWGVPEGLGCWEPLFFICLGV